jgi:NAD(P)-dependent dehydrogenase (short-subunit alcohol dehydrogenase family)
MVARAVERFGALHFLVNNAWGRKEPDGTAETLTETSWDYGMDVMVKAHFLAVKHAVPHMRRAGGGCIVNIASVHGFLMAPARLCYEAAKSAVIGITKQMAIDFGPDGIRVNAVCPGLIVTERGQKRFEANAPLKEFLAAQYPVGRTGVPDDIAKAVRFLCSDESSFITGHALVVDGGMTIQIQEDFGIAQAKFWRAHPETEIP